MTLHVPPAPVHAAPAPAPVAAPPHVEPHAPAAPAAAQPGFFGQMSGIWNSGLVSSLRAANGLTGGVAGVAQAQQDMAQGQYGRGLLHSTAAGTSLVGATAFATGMEASALAGPIGIAAALAAHGSQKTQDWGWYGDNERGEHRSDTEFVSDATSGAYNWTHDHLGGGVLGTVGGGIAGGVTAIGSGAYALGADIVAGGASVIGSIGEGIADLFSW